MRNGFLLALGAFSAWACLAHAQSDHVGKTLPSEQGLQILPTIRVGGNVRTVEEVKELPPLIVTDPQKRYAGPPPIAAVAAGLHVVESRPLPRLPRIHAFLELLKHAWWKIFHGDE